MQMQGGQEEAPLLYFHITVLLLSSPNKQTQKPVGERGEEQGKKKKNTKTLCLAVSLMKDANKFCRL